MRRTRGGFTLIELLVVMAVIATLLSIAVPRYFIHLDRAREASLRESLAVMRDALDKYRADTGRYPESLQELADKHYLRRVPADPLLKMHAVWDLGFADSMAIICVQRAASELRVVDYIEDSRRALPSSANFRNTSSIASRTRTSGLFSRRPSALRT